MSPRRRKEKKHKGEVYRMRERVRYIETTPENKYVVQEIDAAGDPVDEPFTMRKKDFDAIYISEASIIRV